MNNKSFTLIELLVVIVIIGILVGVIMISTSSSIDKANIAKLKVFEGSVLNNLTATMVSRWSLDKIEGVTTPDLWGNNTGILGDGLTSTTYPTLLDEKNCISGKCMNFDGGDYIKIVNDASLRLTNFTISLWMKLSNTSPATAVVGKNTQIIHYDDVFEAQCTGGNGIQVPGQEECDENMVINKWYFLTYTKNSSGNYKFYRNSKLTMEGNYSSTGMDNDYDFFIGVYYSGGLGGFFRGVIDEVRVYDGALSLSYAKKEYLTGLNLLLLKGAISKKEYDLRLNELANIDF